MKRLIASITIVLLFVTTVLLVFNQPEPTDSVMEPESVYEGVTVTESYESEDLIFYEPVFENISLRLNHERDTLGYCGIACNLVVAAAYTEVYNWSEFHHKLIDGGHVVDGVYHEGCPCKENTGAFIYADKHWKFVVSDFDDHMKAAGNGNNSCAFAQTMLVHDSQLIQLPAKLQSGKKALRRALCDYHNRLIVVDSKENLTMSEFAAKLYNAGMFSALYLDMGTMRHSRWRAKDGDPMIDIHPSNDTTKYATNYLMFFFID